MRRHHNEIMPATSFRVQEAWSRLGSDVALMEARGYSLDEREDYVFRSLRDLEARALNEQSGGFDLLRGFKKMIADKIADVVGLQPGFLRDVVTNFIAGLKISDVKSFMSAGSCKPLVTKLAAAVQGAIVDKVLAALGLQPGGFFSIAITEALKSGFVQDGPFVKIVSETVCKIKISELLPGGGIKNLFGGGKKTAAAVGAVAAAAGVAGAAPAAGSPSTAAEPAT